MTAAAQVSPHEARFKGSYTANPVMFKASPFMFILCLLLIPAGIGIVFLLFWKLQCMGTKLTVSEGAIHLERGLLSKTRTEIDCDSVRTVQVQQTFLNRIFGVGRIVVYTAGDEAELNVDGLPDPNMIRDVIKGNKDGI